MSFTKQQVIIDLDEYNALKNQESTFDSKLEEMRVKNAKLDFRSREFVSALSFLEDKGLLDEFNKSMNKLYKLESVGLNKTYKKLVSE